VDRQGRLTIPVAPRSVVTLLGTAPAR